MRTSDQIDAVSGALAKAQGEFPPVEKRKTAKLKGESRSGRAYEYEYKYADIADVLAAVLPVLSRNELAIIQPTVVESGAVYIRTRLAHKSGQWVESDYPVCSVNGDHQKMGAALTYSRRYALCSLLGIAAEEDTDGQDAAELPSARPARKSSAAAKRDGDHTAIEQELAALPTLEALFDWEDDHADRISALPSRWRNEWLPEIIDRRRIELLKEIATPHQAQVFEDLRAILNRATTPPDLQEKAKSEGYRLGLSELPALLQDAQRRVYKRRWDELKSLELVA